MKREIWLVVNTWAHDPHPSPPPRQFSLLCGITRIFLPKDCIYSRINFLSWGTSGRHCVPWLALENAFVLVLFWSQSSHDWMMIRWLVCWRDMVKSDHLPDCSFEWQASSLLIISFAFFFTINCGGGAGGDGQIPRVGEIQKQLQIVLGFQRCKRFTWRKA